MKTTLSTGLEIGGEIRAKSREVKMKTAITTILIISGLVGCAKANLVDSNSIIEDDIEYYIQTDKFVYDLGEDVEILYRITNLRDEKWEVHGLAPVQDIVVAAKEEEDFNEIWKWGWYNVPITGPEVLRLEPGESAEISDTWPQIDWMGTWEIEDDTQVPPGTYRISGVADGVNHYVEPPMEIHTRVAVDITILPEPNSLVLFVASLAILKYINRRKRG